MPTTPGRRRAGDCRGVDVILNSHHRKLLSMRTYRNKFAVQAGYQAESQFVKAIQDLLDNDYIVKIDTYFNKDMQMVLDVYLLTPKGMELVSQHNIIAVDP